MRASGFAQYKLLGWLLNLALNHLCVCACIRFCTIQTPRVTAKFNNDWSKLSYLLWCKIIPLCQYLHKPLKTWVWRTHCQTIYRKLVWSPHCGVTHRKESSIITSWNCFAGLTVNHSPPPPLLVLLRAEQPKVVCQSYFAMPYQELSLYRSLGTMEVSKWQSSFGIPEQIKFANCSDSPRSLNIVVYSNIHHNNILNHVILNHVVWDLKLSWPSLVVVSSQYVSLILFFNSDNLVHLFRFLWGWFLMSRIIGSVVNPWHVCYGVNWLVNHLLYAHMHTHTHTHTHTLSQKQQTQNWLESLVFILSLRNR